MVPTTPSKKYEAIGVRIADGKPLDWQAIVQPDDDATLLEGMRLIERIMQSHQQLDLDLAPTRTRSPSEKFGALEMIELLSAGAEGEVWRAHDPMLDKEVALKLHKVESGALAHQFLEEARKLARIRQANVVSVYGAAFHGFRAGIWIELIHGKSLAEILAAHGPFAAEDVRAIGLDLCDALSAIHGVGLVHGDLKLDNVMRENTGRTVLLDFGSADELAGSKSRWIVRGTIQYIAPEVLNGFEKSPASDIYALGVVMFRLLSGTYPYVSNDPIELQREHRANSRKRIEDLRSDLQPTFAAAINRALEPDPRQRYAAAPTLAVALRAPLKAAPVRTAPVVFVGIVAAAIAAMAGFAATHWRADAWITQATLYKVYSTNSVALTDSARIAPDDHLELRFRSDRAAFVYVFDNDGSDSTQVLFPLQGAATQNPLAANIDHTLPGTIAGQDVTWQIKSIASHEELIVIGSDQPLPALSRIIATWQQTDRNDDPAVSRGSAVIVPAPPRQHVSSVQLNAALRDLLDDSRGDAHVKHWRFELTTGI